MTKGKLTLNMADFETADALSDTRLPITDTQWRKIKRLDSCRLRGYDRKFVEKLVKAPYDYIISPKQSEHIERLWHRYRKQHNGALAPPRWIEIYKRLQRVARTHDRTFEYSAIGKFYAAQPPVLRRF